MTMLDIDRQLELGSRAWQQRASLPPNLLHPNGCCCAVAKLCQQAGIAHIINNAYGAQSAALCAQVQSSRCWAGGQAGCSAS